MDLKYESVWPVLIGGSEVYVGNLAREPGHGPATRHGQMTDMVAPAVFAAGLTPYALKTGSCGFGDSTAAAVADYFRWQRADYGAL